MLQHCFNQRSRTGLKLFGLFTCFLLLSLYGSSQIAYDNTDGRTNTINTGVPFLRIGPDARSGAMGNVGIALSPDVNAVYWNLSKLPFAEKEMGASLSYTPWLREMANDLFLAYLSAYKKLDEVQTVGMSLRYFDMGNVQLTNFQGEDNGRTHPKEFAIDAGYARKLSDNWSLGVALRYIHSDLASGVKQESGESYKAGSAVAGDISVYYQGNIDSSAGAGNWSFGAAMTNLGSKIGYTSNKENLYFLPANLGMGGAYTYHFNEENSLTVSLDVNKLLVPTPDTIDANKDNIPDYRSKGVVSGIFSSFGDAPGGFTEEFHELMYSVGAEYWYDHLFALRAGYYNEYKTKGNRKYVSVGFGLKYKLAGLDFSYLIPSGGEMQKNPLSNTVRLTISVSK